MSVAGILSSSFLTPSVTQGTQNKFQQIQSEFQQLGQDLTAGNLSQAQQDFASLTQNLPSSQQANATSGNNPVAQAFATLRQGRHGVSISGKQF